MAEQKNQLNGEHKQPCLTVQKDTNGKIAMEVLEPLQIKAKIKENLTEKVLLQMLLLYGKHGSLKAVQKERLMHDDLDAIVDELIDSQQMHTISCRLSS